MLALAPDCGVAEARARVAPWVPPGWDVTTHRAPWGTALASGPGVIVDGDLIFLGAAVADPWGLPGADLDGRTVLRRFARYGASASQLAAGPFAVADTAAGTLMAAFNSIIPVYLGAGSRVAVGTHPGLVAALAGSAEAERVPPGSAASVAGTAIPVTDLEITEALPLVSLAGLDKEIAHHIRRAGRSRRSWTRPGGRDYRTLRVRTIQGALVAAPHLSPLSAAANPLADLAHIRRLVAQLWWSAGLRGVQVFVPALERPSVDTMMLGLESPT